MSKKAKNFSRLTIHRRCVSVFDCDYCVKRLAKFLEEKAPNAEVTPLTNVTESHLTGAVFYICFANVTIRNGSRQNEADIVTLLADDGWSF